MPNSIKLLTFVDQYLVALVMVEASCEALILTKKIKIDFYIFLIELFDEFIS
jgi:hypothetical protein